MNFKHILFSFSKKGISSALLFLFVLGFASLSKKDIEKLTHYKKRLFHKNESHSFKVIEKSDIIQEGNSNISTESISPSIADINEDGKEAWIKTSETFVSYSATTSGGEIGTFDINEIDNVRDNIFDIILPENINTYNHAYLEYELYGLASHMSVPRSINKNQAIGGNFIMPSAKWSSQIEEINFLELVPGANKILFTAPSQEVKYKIKNIRISLSKKAIGKVSQVNALAFEDNLYIKGFKNHIGKILIDDHVLESSDLTIDKVLNTKDFKNKSIEIFNNNHKEIINAHNIKKPYRIITESEYITKTEILSTEKKEFELENIHFKILDNTFDGSSVLKVSALRNKDMPALTGDLKNTFLGVSGFRLQLNSKPQKKITVTTPYDEKKLGLNLAKEIKAFYFDYHAKKWTLIPNSTVDEINKTITFEANGEGDYINGIVSAPESPETNAYAPTIINDIKDGDPASQVKLFTPPSLDQKGDANLSYPIVVPSGRKGLQPNLNITYNSSASNGWMGEGWGISGLSSITLDTRWGAPSFGTEETELYSLDGEMLVYPNDYLPHRHNLTNEGQITTLPQSRNQSGVKSFYLRNGHDFSKIERYGNTPSNYRWIITSTTGIKSYYGGDENSVNGQSVIRNEENNIVHWGIYKIEDPNTNNIKFYYDNVVVGGAGILSGAKAFNIKQIKYTGHNNQDGAYLVEFKKENTIERGDVTVNAKQGVKIAEPHRLKEIIVKTDNLNKRIYKFSYVSGEFNKSLLTNIEVDENTGNSDIYNFDYYNDLKQGTTTLPLFGPDVNVTTFNNTEYPTKLPIQLNAPSKIESNYSFEEGWSTRISAGIDVAVPNNDRYGHITGALINSISTTITKKAQQLIDFDGDGIIDIIYKKNSGLFYRSGNINVQGSLNFGIEKQIQNFNSNFNLTTSKSKTAGSDVGGRVKILWFDLGLNVSNVRTHLNSTTSTFLVDANSDGLVDISHNGQIWFNKLENNQTIFTPFSAQTENMLIEDKKLDTEPNNIILHDDVVKVWIAPKDGYITIKDNIYIENIPGANAIYSIEMKRPGALNQLRNIRVYLTKLNAGDATKSINISRYNDYFNDIQSLPPANNNNHIGINDNSRLYVKAGDKIFFRLHENENENENYKVFSSPEVWYTFPTGMVMQYGYLEGDNFKLHGKYQDSFFLNNDTKYLDLNSNGTATISIPQISFPSINDDVHLRIIKKHISSNTETTLFDHTFYQNIPTSHSLSPLTLPTITVSASDPIQIFATVNSDSHRDYINTGLNNIKTTFNVPGTGDVTSFLIPSYNSNYVTGHNSAYTLSPPDPYSFDPNAPPIPQGIQNFGIQINKEIITNTLPLQSNTHAEFKYIVRKGAKTIGKRKVFLQLVNNALQITEQDLTTGQIVNGVDPLIFYTGDIQNATTTNDDRISILVFCDYAYHTKNYQKYAELLNNRPFNVYFNNGQNVYQTLPQTSINSKGFNFISKVYNNWGQFLYREEYEKGYAVCQQEGICDEYGVVIEGVNDFDVNINIPQGSCDQYATDPQQYAACIAQFAQNTTFVLPDRIFPMSTFKTQNVEKWIGFGPEQYTMPDSFKDDGASTGAFTNLPSGYIDPSNSNVTPLANEEKTKMESTNIQSYSSSKTKTLSGGASPFSNLGYTESNTIDPGDIKLTDFMDVNGDGYPDRVSRASIQYTRATGGFNAATNSLINSPLSENSSELKMTNLSLAYSQSKNLKTVNSTENTGDSVSTAVTDKSSVWTSGTAGINGTANFDSKNTGKSFWLDINGDGLSDYITTNYNNELFCFINNGKKLINYNPATPLGDYPSNFPNLKTYSSIPKGSVGVSFGGSLTSVPDLTAIMNFGFGISMSAGQSASTSSSNTVYNDINGDGLIDILNIYSDKTTVSYNRGTYFDNEIEIKKNGNTSPIYTNEVKSNNGFVSFGGEIKTPIAFVPFLPPPLFIINLIITLSAEGSVNFGTNITDVDKVFMDVNGDGYADLVRTNGSDLIVNYSQIGKTNRLKQASNANTNLTYNIEYTRTKPSYEDPNARLIMSRVIVNNPDILSPDYTQNNSNKNIIQQFEYTSPVYDRRERKFFGFAKVTMENYRGTSLYNRTINNYYNKSYHTSGLLKSSENYSQNTLVSKLENEYNLYSFNNTDTGLNINLSSTNAAFATFDSGGKEGRRKAVIKIAKTKTTEYDNGGSISTTKEFNYNSLGLVNVFQYESPSTIYHSRLTYQSGLQNNIVSVPSSISVYAGSASTTAAFIRRRTMEADNNGNIIKFSVYNSQNGFSTTDYNYNYYGNLISVEYPPNDSNERYKINYQYDTNYNKYIIESTDIFGVTSKAEYHPHHDLPTKTTDPSGSEITYDYDNKGRLIKVLGPKEKGLDEAYTIIINYDLIPWKPNSNIKIFTSKTIRYDAQNPSNPIESYAFADLFGQMVQTKKDIEIDGIEKMSISGMVVKDSFGRITKEYHHSTESKNDVVNKALNLTIIPSLPSISYTYDYKDRPLTTVDENGNTSSSTYQLVNNQMIVDNVVQQATNAQLRTKTYSNTEGKVVKKLDYLGTTEVKTEFHYDEIGQLRKVKDPVNLEIHYNYDIAGRKISQIHPDRGTTTYQYDQANNLIRSTSDNLINDPNISVPYISYTYNYNRLTGINFPDLTNGPNPANVSYEYNTEGRIQTKVFDSGYTEYEYGNIGEIIKERNHLENPNFDTTLEYEYDTWNRVKQIKYHDGEVVNYTYDLGGNLKSVIGQDTYIANAKYDAYGQRTEILYGNGTKSQYQYRMLDRKLQTHTLTAPNEPYALLENHYDYDFVGNIKSMENNTIQSASKMGGHYSFTYAYDELNRLTLSDGKFNIIEKQEDEYNPPVQVALTSPYVVSNSRFDLNLEYDHSGGILVKQQNHEQDLSVNSNNSYHNTYSYINGTHQVEAIDDINSGEQDYFKYDSNGNPIEISTAQYGPIRMYWDEQDRLKAHHTLDVGTYQYYTYNDTGERTRKITFKDEPLLYQNGVIINSGITILNYKLYPNPYTVKSSNGSITKHYYEGSKRIASRVYPNMEVIVIDWDTAPMPTFKKYLELEEIETDNITEEFERPNIFGGLYYYHTDHLGTATFVTNKQAEPTQFFINLPFGETMAEQHMPNAYDNPYKFNAKELDSETGLYYYGARYYNPKYSIWYGVDPLAEKYPNWSPYSYTFNNPIIYTDPDGRDPKPGMLILSYRGYLGGWNASSRSSGSTSFNLAYGLSKYTTMNYPVSGVQVNIGYDSFYFKDRTTAWAYIKAINNLDAINNNEAHHATFNSSVKIGSKTYDTSQRPQNYDDGAATGQAISELGCNCGAVMMGSMGAFTAGRSTGGQRVSLKYSDPQPNGQSFGYTISDGKLNINGRAVTNGTFDYVITNSGELKIGSGHYYLSGGAESVQMAGRLKIWQGNVKPLNGNSGHYRPTAGETATGAGLLNKIIKNGK